MDIPRPIKIFLYSLTFVLIVFGLASKVSWFIFLFALLMFYGIGRFLVMSCHHRFTAIPMVIMLGIIVLFNAATIQTSSLLLIAMAIDVFI